MHPRKHSLLLLLLFFSQSLTIWPQAALLDASESSEPSNLALSSSHDQVWTELSASVKTSICVTPERFRIVTADPSTIASEGSSATAESAENFSSSGHLRGSQKKQQQEIEAEQAKDVRLQQLIGQVVGRYVSLLPLMDVLFVDAVNRADVFGDVGESSTTCFRFACWRGLRSGESNNVRRSEETECCHCCPCLSVI